MQQVFPCSVLEPAENSDNGTGQRSQGNQGTKGQWGSLRKRAAYNTGGWQSVQLRWLPP